MPRLLACVDNSSYANSVCDHAAWLAAGVEGEVQVLNVLEERLGERAQEADEALVDTDARSRSDLLLDHAVWRLRDEGVSDLTRLQLTGDLVDAVARRNPDMVVMGKRGEGSESRRRRLGSSVDAMVRGTTAPICLTSKLFLPIRRGLILLDADPAHLQALDFLGAQARFRVLVMDVVVVCGPGADPQPKLDKVRAALPDHTGDVFVLEADGLDAAAARYIESRAADVVVVSRPVISPNPQDRLLRIEEHGVWGLRTPVVIC